MDRRIKTLFRELSSTLDSPTGALKLSESLGLMALNYDTELECTHYVRNATTKEVEQLSRTRFDESNIRHLHFFSQYDNAEQDPFVCTIERQRYFAHPLSLWLGPTCFLLFPAEEAAEWEKIIQEKQASVQAQLEQWLWDDLADKFRLEYLIQLDEKTLSLQLGQAIAERLCAYAWECAGEPLQHCNAHLFNEETDFEELEIVAEAGGPLFRFKVPQHSIILSQKCSLAWDYEANRLNRQKNKLIQYLTRFVNHLWMLYTEAQDLLNSSRTIPMVSNHIERIETEVKDIQAKVSLIQQALTHTKDRIQTLYSHTGTFDPDAYHFYRISEQSYKVIFEGKEIVGMGKQFCHILHVLFSHPNVNHDMRVLYDYTKTINKFEEIEEETSGELSELSQKQLLIGYVRDGYITYDEVLSTIDPVEKIKLRSRLEGGITLLRRSREKFPELSLGSLLEDYESYYEQFAGARLDEAFILSSQVFPENEVSKKQAKERISVQWSSGLKHLLENGHSRFVTYLKTVIKRETIDSGHLYTFRPSYANDEAWREIVWQLTAER